MQLREVIAGVKPILASAGSNLMNLLLSHWNRFVLLAGIRTVLHSYSEATPTLRGQYPMHDLVVQLGRYRLTTAEILYHMPDHPGVLQTYLWQDLDMAPRFPVLAKFLNFWTRNLDGKLHSVTVASSQIIKPAEFRLVGAELRLH